MNVLNVAYNEASPVQWHALWVDQAAVVMFLARRKTNQASGLFR
jgi:hypothetical protein